MAVLPLSKSPDRNYELGMLIGRSRRLVMTAAARRLEAQGESILAWQVLNRLRREGPMSQCELAASTGQHPAGISRLLETLEGSGEVRRARDRKDRRKLQVAVTPSGLRRLVRLEPEMSAAVEEVFSPLSKAERRTLRHLLGKLLGLRLSGTD